MKIKKAPEYQHRILTNGEQFKVETWKDGKWELERTYVVGYVWCGLVDITHKSYKSALKWIEKEYGSRAEVQPRQWREV